MARPGKGRGLFTPTFCRAASSIRRDMGYTARILTAVLCLFLSAACNRSAPSGTVQAGSPSPVPGAAAATRHEVRVTGAIQAVHAVKVTVPIIQGQFSTMTLTQLVPNGSHVEEGELVATFDPTQQMDAARDAQAKFEDLGHQVDQKLAENRVSAENRNADLRQAEADLAKAQLELTKRAVLAPIEAERNDAMAAAATAYLASLKKSQAAREKSEAAALRGLELQRDRQKINMQRAEDNIQKLSIHAPLSGMVVHEMTYRASSYGHAQVGDQMNRSYPLVSIFDPSEMQVRCAVNEADIRTLTPGSTAVVHLDAYPDLELTAHFSYASPVASSALGTPIKSFAAVFRIDKPDKHLLPDLSAAVVLQLPQGPANGGRR